MKAKSTFEKKFLEEQIELLGKKGVNFLPQGMDVDLYIELKSKKEGEDFSKTEPLNVRSERILSEIHCAVQNDSTGTLPTIEEAEETFEAHKNEFAKDRSYLFSLIQIWCYITLIRCGVKPMPLLDQEKKETNEQRLTRVVKEIQNYNKFIRRIETELQQETTNVLKS